MKYLIFLLVILSFALSGCKEFPDDLPKPSDNVPGKILLLDSLTQPDAKTGWWPDIATDDRGHVHAIYCDVYHGDLVYTFRGIDGVWNKERVDVPGAVGKYASMAVSGAGEVHVAYYDQTQKYLRYAKRSLDGVWTKSNVVWGLEVGMASETVLDNRGNPHIFYYSPAGFLVHATPRANDATKWDKHELAEALGGFSARISPIVVKDTIWISYLDWNFSEIELHLGKLPIADPRKFTTEFISKSNNPGWQSQLGFIDGEPQILATSSMTRHLYIHTKVQGVWQSKPFVKKAISFEALTLNNKWIILYEDADVPIGKSGVIRMLKGVLNSWEHFSIDLNGPNGNHLALTQKDGKILAAYYSEAVRGLKVYDELLSPKLQPKPPAVPVPFQDL